MLRPANRMMLSKLLEGITVSKMFNTLFGQMAVTQDVQIGRIQYDSRKVTRGDLFVAMRGTASDGHRFIGQAVANGARVVVLEDDAALPDSYFMHAGTIKVVVPNSRIALARMSSAFYDHPSEKLTMIGVTGTNGKTTTTHLVQSMLEAGGRKSGLLGTIAYRIGSTTLPATHTTPESLELNSLLARMVAEHCSSAVMEVSSHALDQHRVEGIRFKAAVFTNLTQDHLDYHGTMENYFGAKKTLFEGLGRDGAAIINIDDEWGGRLMNATPARTISYGMSPDAAVRADRIQLSIQGTRFSIVHAGEETPVESSLIGKFNVSNILAAFGTGIALEIPKPLLQRAIRSAPGVAGRFERIASPAGWVAVIDYAHTPDALEKALKAIHAVFGEGRRGKIITVFGCGGNRDRTKRPKMASAATELSDLTVVTSDNPRQEDPERIIDEIMAGVKTGAAVLRQSDRRSAILEALGRAASGDVVLIAGKGHEDYQVIGETKIHFSDREIVEEYLRGAP